MLISISIDTSTPIDQERWALVFKTQINFNLVLDSCRYHKDGYKLSPKAMVESHNLGK